MTRFALALAILLAAPAARAQVRAPVAVILSSGALAIDSLPAGALPPPLDPAKVPPVLRGEAPADVRITLDGVGPKMAASALATWRKKREPAAWVALDGKPDHPVWFEQAGPQPTMRTVCGNGYGMRATALRWFSLERSAAGTTLEVTDGWLDVLACSLVVERRTSVSVVPLVSVDGIPIALAFRDPASESVTLLFPPNQSVAAESLGRDLASPTSTTMRVTLPVTKGGASSAAMAFVASNSPEWPKVFGAPLPSWQAAGSGVEVAIDVIESVADARATLLVRAETAR